VVGFSTFTLSDMPFSQAGELNGSLAQPESAFF
jgi:hypothetical protein